MNSPYPLPVRVLPHLRVPTGLYFPRAIGTCGQEPSHKPAKYKPPQTASKPLSLSAPLFRLLSSQIKLQRREVRSSSMLGRVCVSDKVNQRNGSAVSQPYPCSGVQGLHFRQTPQSPDSDFSRQVAACLVHTGNRCSSLVSWLSAAKSKDTESRAGSSCF